MHRRSTLTGLLVAILAGAAVAVGAATSTAGTRAPGRLAPSPHAAAASAGHLSLPAPTGSDRVGTIAVPVPDPSRGGETMVQLFYPSRVGHGRPAPYMPAKTASLTASTLHVPLAVIAGIVTHALAGPPAAPGPHPVVLFSPGLTELRSDDTALCTELASHGFVVVAIDHVHESAIVEFPNGRVIRGSFLDSQDPQTSTRLRAAAVRARVRDVAAVLRALPEIDQRGLLRRRLDLRRIGMFGFSIGGATADEAMHALPQIRAGVNLDGSLYGNSLRRPLDRPFLFLARDGHSTASDPSWDEGWATLRGWRREIHLIGSGHGDFTDLAGLIAQFTPGFTDPTGYYGPIPPSRATAATRQVLTAFFERFLMGDRHASGPLNAPEHYTHDLQRLR
jgi:dienelactone hydrolase